MSWTEFFEGVREVLDTQLFSIGRTPVTLSTLLTTLLIFIATLIMSRIVRAALRRALAKRVGHEGTLGAINGLVHYSVLIIGISICLQTMGVDLTALFAAGAVFAVGIGFAMKNIAENFVSGVILLGERSIRPGDVIDVEGRMVRVERMGIRATLVRTRDGEDIIMPNSTLVQSAVTNYTLQESIYRVRYPVGVIYASDMELVIETLAGAAKEAKAAMPDLIADRPIDIFMSEFGDNSVNFEVAIWLTDPWQHMSIKSRLAQHIWWALKERGIVIAFPQVDVHFDAPVATGLASLANKAA